MPIKTRLKSKNMPLIKHLVSKCSEYASNLLICVFLALVAGCETQPYSDKTYSISGTLTGLTTEGLEISDLSGERLELVGKQFSFTKKLRTGEPYEVMITKQPPLQVCKVHNGSGVVEELNIENVEIHCRSWLEEEPIFSQSSSVTKDIQFSLDEGRHAVAVWQQDVTTGTGVESNIMASLYSRSDDNWFSTVRVNQEQSGAAKKPQLAVLGDRNLIVVWQQTDENGENIYVARYMGDELGWSSPVAVSLNTGGRDAVDPKIALNKAGQAMIVWQQSDGILERIWSSVLNTEDGWGWELPRIVNTGFPLGDASQVDIVVDPAGNVAATWMQSDGGGITDILTNIYVSAAGAWSNPIRIENSSNSATSPRITLDSNGNVLVAWVQKSALDDDLSVWVNILSRRNNVVSWTVAEELAVERGVDASPDIQAAAYGSGQIIVVWSQEDGSTENTKRIWAVTRSAEGQWSGGLLANFSQSGPEKDSENPQIAQDSDGNVIVVWKQSILNTTVHTEIWANIYTPVSGWGTPRPIDGTSTENSVQPRIAMGANGEAMAIWRKEGLTGDLVSNRFE